MKPMRSRHAFELVFVGVGTFLLFAPSFAIAAGASAKMKSIGFSWLSGCSEGYPCFFMGWKE